MAILWTYFPTCICMDFCTSEKVSIEEAKSFLQMPVGLYAQRFPNNSMSFSCRSSELRLGLPELWRCSNGNSFQLGFIC